MLNIPCSERNEIASSHARQKKDLMDMTVAMQSEFADAEADARQEYESVREEVKNRNSEEYNVLKIQLEGIIEELERHFEQVGVTHVRSYNATAQLPVHPLLTCTCMCLSAGTCPTVKSGGVGGDAVNSQLATS